MQNCPPAKQVVLEAELLPVSPSWCHLGQEGAQQSSGLGIWRHRGWVESLQEPAGRKTSSVKGARERAKFLERGPCKEGADDMKK